MGTMKRKRRKKQAAAWSRFQQEHQLSDEELKMARSMGSPLEKLKERLADSAFSQSTATADRIREIHRKWKDRLEARKAAVKAGLIDPPAKKKKKKVKHDPVWAKAKTLCQLNMEDVRKAKELGMSPRSLIKNISSRSQPWKAPVKIWIRELYEERQAKAARKKARQTVAESVTAGESGEA